MPRRRDNVLYAALGARLRAIRTAAGWSQEQLAGAVGIAPNNLSYYENGRKGLTITTLAAIAGVLGTRLADLVDVDLPVPSTIPPPEEDALMRAVRGLPEGAREVVAALARDLARRWPVGA